MAEVTGPIIATTAVLMAVFVPVAFIPGVTGRLYNQFALTVAISVGISAFNSLTLSPALSAAFLRQPAAGQLRTVPTGSNPGFERQRTAYAIARRPVPQKCSAQRRTKCQRIERGDSDRNRDRQRELIIRRPVTPG